MENLCEMLTGMDGSQVAVVVSLFCFLLPAVFMVLSIFVCLSIGRITFANTLFHWARVPIGMVAASLGAGFAHAMWARGGPWELVACLSALCLGGMAFAAIPFRMRRPWPVFEVEEAPAAAPAPTEIVETETVSGLVPATH